MKGETAVGGSFAAASNRLEAHLSHIRLPDFAMGVALSVWLLYLLTTASLSASSKNLLPPSVLWSYASDGMHMAYQLSIISAGFLLLACAGVKDVSSYLTLALQGMVAIALLRWYQSSDIDPGGFTDKVGHAWAYQAWAVANLIGSVWLTVVVSSRMRGINSARGWLILAGCLTGFGLGLNHLMIGGGFRAHASVSDYLYAMFLIGIWYLTARHPYSSRPDFQTSSIWETEADFSPIQNEVALALEMERRRISQDLHDGVGSHIAGILSVLEHSGPEQQHLVLALEHCLIDLKMTVDALDEADRNVIDALGSMRYRFQHTFDRLNINLIWNLEFSSQLEEMRGIESQQALRIAQESLANVIRHAQASVVEVVCQYDPASHQMILDIRDNGKGIAYMPEGSSPGKGMKSMRQRANHVGGTLTISSKLGVGTCVRLTLPLRVAPP